ncbi:MAG: glycoside hydrolase family 9 protein, partial [Cyclobacteriaceae bacterium]|nr:glycoside hydrolase family 9 protein [Cyclobacteriaceae bacterium]
TDKPIPERWAGKAYFSLELFPGQYFERTYYMDETPGLFPRQINGPVHYNNEKQIEVRPMATGGKLVVLPESPDEMIVFESLMNDLELVDGRAQRNNGWFVLRSSLKEGIIGKAAEWLITPAYEADYTYQPVIQVSQVGYRPNQQKIAVLEMDKRVKNAGDLSLLRISGDGGYETVMTLKPEMWGKFLRYQYAQVDFSEVSQPGMYRLEYGEILSEPFMIHDDVFKRHVWQPTLEYYLPVQMCHMRINDRVKVWHGLCHNDDALMAPVDHIHFDGYRQGPSTLSKFKPFDPVPGLNVGGWHDAGDYDLRVESQANTTRMLAFTWELFRPEHDETTVDQENKLVEMHMPDGIPDILQQIEHGALTVVGGYKSMGRLYRGIICPTGRQYSLLGDGSVMTDNLVYSSQMDSSRQSGTHSGIRDDRWVFTEENPRRELDVAACLATTFRSLKGYNDDLAEDCLETAEALYEGHLESQHPGLVDAAAALYLSTEKEIYLNFLLSNKKLITENIRFTGPAIARVASRINDTQFLEEVREVLKDYAMEVDSLMNETPYGVSYRPAIWGAGWIIQRFGVNQYFLHRGFPEIFPAEPVYNAMNFVLGVHPGENTASFVSGVGAKSLLVAYGVNRDEWSYIPGGSASGTALIRPDLPELKIWPYLWQQTEYVMGGGALNYMFLVLASDDLLENGD